MADITLGIYVKVLTLEPAQGEMIPVPGVQLLCEDSGFLWDPDLSNGSPATNADGVAEVEITFDEEKETQLNPFFTISIPAAQRTIPATAAADKQFTLPEEWVTRHYVNRRIPRIRDHADPNNPLEIFVGLPVDLNLAYPDFDNSGVRNPLALPEDTVRVYLADYDSFIFDWLNPDDTMTGFGYDPRPAAQGGDRIIPMGEDDQYKFYDVWPTVPCALDAAPATPIASIDPPRNPVGHLGGGSFGQTGPLAVDSHGFVFIIDGNQVRRFYPDGTLAETITGPVSGIALSNPQGLALDQYRNLFVSDTGNNRILLFKPDWEEGGLSGAVNAGRGYYAHSAAFGAYGGGTLEFDQPKGLAVVHERAVDNEEWLAVADSGNRRVQILRIHCTGSTYSLRASYPFLVNLVYLTDFGTPAVGSPAAATTPVAAELWEPTAVAADWQKRLFVCDYAWHRVSRWHWNNATSSFDHNADWEKTGGGSGAGNREFDAPNTLCLDIARNFLYVAELGNQRIQRLDSDSGNHQLNWEYSLSAPRSPVGVAADLRGEVYVADNTHQRVIRGSAFDAAGVLLADSDQPRGVDTWTPQNEGVHMNAPAYVAFDADGKLWVSDSGNNRVLAFSRNINGELVADTAPAAAGLDNPVGITHYETGDLFVVDSGNHRVRRYDAALAHIADIGSGTPGGGNNEFDNPRGIAVARQAEPVIYIADRDNNRVKMHKFNGDYIHSITTDGSINLSAPEDVTIDAQGRLYIADTGNNRILQFQLAMNGPVNTAPAFVRVIQPTGYTLQNPSGVSLDTQGKLLITDRQSNQVYRIEADGDVLGRWNMDNFVRQSVAQGTAYYPELARILHFKAPVCAAMDTTGLLVITDTEHDQVRLLRSSTRVQANLFDVGQGLFENLPDISLRVKADMDWSSTLGLRVDADQAFEAEPDDDFAGDQWHYEKLLATEDFHPVGINSLKVARIFQQWFQQHSRMATAERRWGNLDDPISLNVDVEAGGSFYLLDVNLDEEDGGATHGRGADGWDDSVVAHEMAHWVFTQNTFPYPILPLNIFRWIRMGSSHSLSKLGSEDQALSEGWAEYVEHFWGGHYGSKDRLRGFSLWGSGSSLKLVREDSSSPWEHIYGGQFTTSHTPDFNEPNKALRSEGYFSNALYQIHRSLIGSDVMFADSSCYWHGYNFYVTEAVSQRYSETFWKALERFQGTHTVTPDSDGDGIDEIEFHDGPSFSDSGSRLFLKYLLEEIISNQPWFAQTAQTILELNNLCMPVITVHEEVSPGSLSDSVDDEVDVQVGVEKIIAFKVATVTGFALSAYNLHIEITSGSAAHYGLDAGIAPTAAHGQSTPAPIPPGQFYRATDGDGMVRLKINIPGGAANANETIQVTYQPDFDNDSSFDPPIKGDDNETCYRKLYLYELRSAGKYWNGTGNNFGARVRQSVTIGIS